MKVLVTEHYILKAFGVVINKNVACTALTGGCMLVCKL